MDKKGSRVESIGDYDINYHITGKNRGESQLIIYRDDKPVGKYYLGKNYKPVGIDSLQVHDANEYIDGFKNAHKRGEEEKYIKKHNRKSEKMIHGNKCPPGLEYVPSFHKRDGTYVKGFCRKIRR